jgi:hypothetical protein
VSYLSDLDTWHNMTVTENIAPIYAGVFVFDAIKADLRNGIFWNNTALSPGSTSIEDQQLFVTALSGGTLNVSFSDIEDGNPNDTIIPFGGPPNIDDDPLFTNAALDNFRLSSNSPCIDAAETDGNSASVPQDSQDIDGDDVTTCGGCQTGERTPDLDRSDRVLNSAVVTGDPGVPDDECLVSCGCIVDMGAYEWKAAATCATGVRADLNLDGAANGLDCQDFVICLLNGPTITAGCECADLNADGFITADPGGGDIPCFVDRVIFGTDNCQPACELGSTLFDCNENTAPDALDIAKGVSQDCDRNGIPDECQIDENSTAPGGPWYCTSGCNPDVNNNGRIDSCELDCDNDGLPDSYEIAHGAADCNGNGVPDTCELAGDCNANGIPDDCDVNPSDPDGNGSVSPDCNANGIPDSCDISRTVLASFDCNENSVPDECDIASGFSEDTNANGIPDECEGEGLLGGGAPEGFGGEAAAWDAFWAWYAEALTTPDANGQTLDQLSSADRFAAIMAKITEVGLPYARPW